MGACLCYTQECLIAAIKRFFKKEFCRKNFSAKRLGTLAGMPASLIPFSGSSGLYIREENHASSGGVVIFLSLSL